MTQRRTDIRNVAVIAHVDHGKTTLVDGLLAQGGFFRANQAQTECFMDSMDLERERGITIRSKMVSFMYNGVKVNLIDTPGHADFGGEVERVLGMANGVLLLVDAFDGPMPQTRFVLKKALQHGLKPIVVVNKIDRADARPHVVLDEVFNLFLSLDATDEQLEFAVVYASGRERYAVLDPDKDKRKDLRPLFDALIAHIPGPPDLRDELPALQIATVSYDSYVGRIGVGRIHSGTLRAKQKVAVCGQDGSVSMGQIKELFVFQGLKREPAEHASSGEIVAVCGMEELTIGETLTDPENPRPMPSMAVDRPTISMVFQGNDSPFSGTEGKYCTSRFLRERLARELRSDVALRVETAERAD